LGWSEDLSQTALEAQMTGDSSPGLYLRDSASGSYQLSASVPGYPETYLAGFSAEDHSLIVESAARLLPDATAEKTNLYVLHNGNLSLAGVLPEGEGGQAPAGGSLAGPYDWANSNTSSGGATAYYYTQSAISGDGSRIVFTAGETGRIYVREPDAHPARTIAVSPGQAQWHASTPDGRYVFYTEAEQLYRFDLGSSTPKPEPLTSGAAGVQGTLGVSTDASYVYFVANGILASGASPGACSGVNANGQRCNLYVWHNGETRFVGPEDATQNTLSDSQFGHGDANNWVPQGFGESNKSSRVAPDGKTLLFISQLQLTSYNSAGFEELYRYDATRPVAPGNPVCVSCNPTGVPPTVSPSLQRGVETFKTPHPILPILSRNLSDDGNRIFFETTEALLPQDTNNAGDVYEWEREGAGSCSSTSESFSTSSGGCLYLISTGRSPDSSNFADASANGENVFFFTTQSLVGQDQDHLLDIYDARVNGGIAEQTLLPPVPCAGDPCRGAGSAPPLFGTPASTTFSGAGNLPVPPPTPTSKAKPIKAKALTRAQKLEQALKACAKKPRRTRAACVRQAKRRYGHTSRAAKQGRGGNR
jgi:hypothetical protein